VKTNKNSAFGTMARPFNAEEMAFLNAHITRGYDTFLERVAAGRHMSVANVDSIAQGRVWLGRDALRIKLVDAMGGLYEAIAKAAQLAKTDEYYTANYPAEPDWMDQIMSELDGGDNYLDEKMRQTLGEYYAPFEFLKTINTQNAIQARMPFDLVVK
jgi:protease IV